MRVLTGRKVPLRSLAFSPDGAKLAAGGDRGNVQVWNLRTGQRSRHYLLGDTPVTSVHYLAPDKLAALVPFRLSVIDLDDGRVTPLLADLEPGDGVTRVALAPNRKSLCVGRYSEVARYELLAITVRQWAFPVPPAPYHSPIALAWSGDGATIAVGLESGEVIRLDAATGQERSRVDAEGGRMPRAVAVSYDGHGLAWCAATHFHFHRGEARFHHTLGKTHFLATAWHPSGDFLATANGDGTVDYWDARTGVRRESFDWGGGKVNDVTFDVSGDRAACCSANGNVVVWDVDR